MKTISKYHLVATLVIAWLFWGSLASASSSNNASSYSFNKLTISLCETAKNDRLFHFRHKLRKGRYNIRAIYPEVKCGKKTLLSIAMENQADSVINYLKLKANPEVMTTNNKIAY